MKKFVILFGVLAMLGWVGQASALTPSEVIATLQNDFPGTSDALILANLENGNIGSIYGRLPVQEDEGQGEVAALIGIPLNPARYGKYFLTYYPDGTVSDLVGIGFGFLGMTGYTFGFMSDGEGGLQFPEDFLTQTFPNGQIVPKTIGDPQTGILWDVSEFFGLGAGFNAVYFYSDDAASGQVPVPGFPSEDDADPVPVPGAVLLGAIGLGMVGWVRRRLA